ncbi:MAG TPA: subclass B1 metallo-beta-lactamase [Bacteroidales bacterium]|nr:subclass B1 metallo-beta-lactamase [Bacteroidales bacterium]
MVKRIFLVVVFVFGLFYLKAQTNNNIIINDDIQLIHIDDSVYVHITWESSESFGRFSSNGLIFIKNGQAVMIDTPFDNSKTRILTEYLQDSMHIKIKQLIIGHFHDDCLGGLAYIQAKGIESVANKLTVEKCMELGLPIPATSFVDSLFLDFNGEIIECRYFGGGHSFDNIVVWIPSKKILFGGCLIKSVNSRGLGNLSDAVVEDWDSTVKKLLNHYTDIKFVIPGHGAIGGSELLTHTIKLVESNK